MEILSSSPHIRYMLDVRLFFSCSSKFGGFCRLVMDNNTAADLHVSYPPGSMNVGEFFD